MSASAISSTSNTAYTSPLQPRAEASGAGRDNDGDSDDGGTSAIKAPSPVTNMSGQRIGSTINITV